MDSCREGSACATGSWLLLGLHLLLGVCTEPSPAVAEQLSRTSAPICVVSLHPLVLPLPCSAVLSHPKLALGALDLPRIVPAAQGWTCVSSTEKERLGGWWVSSVPWQGSPHPTVPILHWQDPHTSGIPAEVPGGGEALAAPRPLCWALPFLPAGV